MVDLGAATLVHLAPRSGTSGVGDHADDFAAAARPHVLRVVELRHGPPKADRWSEVRQLRREVVRIVEECRGPVIVHAELSGGAVASFWTLASLRGRGAVLSATVHDAPRPVGYPYLSRIVGRSRWTMHGVHLPLDPVSIRLERRVVSDVHLFALSPEGVAAMEAMHLGRTRGLSHLIVPTRPVLPVPSARPRAVGMFGHVYPGKGFEHLRVLREGLPDDVAVRIAGRGTERLAAVGGTEVLGPVEGAAEDDFFASVRLLVLPYGNRHTYGLPTVPASSALTRALAYGTPTVSPPEGALVGAAARGATVLADGGVPGLAATAARLVADDSALDEAAVAARAHAATQTAESAIAPYVATWADA